MSGLSSGPRHIDRVAGSSFAMRVGLRFQSESLELMSSAQTSPSRAIPSFPQNRHLQYGNIAA